MRIINLLLISTLLSGCALFSKTPQPLPEVKVITEEVPLRIYQPPLPNEIYLEDVQFFVLNKDNVQEQMKRIEKILGGDFVVFAVTPQSYENMASNLQDIRRYINQQKEIILYYREATKSDDGTTREDWLEKNKKD